MKRYSPRFGFTLIELILVMALLSTLMAISAPKLSRYFTGRTLNEETRRFLALTRYGRSEAIGRAVTMELWIDPDQGTYGLEPQVIIEEATTEYIAFDLADDLSFDIGGGSVDEDGRISILFWPDGTIDESSIAMVMIVDRDEKATTIEQADYGLGYYIQDTQNAV